MLSYTLKQSFSREQPRAEGPLVQNNFEEYQQYQTVGSWSGLAFVMLGLIWVPTVFKGYQSTKCFLRANNIHFD